MIKKIGATVVCFICLLSSVAYAHLPGGSYMQTCHDCRAHHGILRCTCNDAQGSPHLTALAYDNCVDISNQNGVLTCDDNYHHHDHHHDDGLPFGSYQGSCHHCFLNANYLYCTCDDQYQVSHHTHVKFTHCVDHNLDIMNNNGQLNCGSPINIPVPNQGNPGELNIHIKL